MHEPGMGDTVFEGAKVHRALAEFSLEEVVMRFEQISNSTMSVLHRQIMDAEHLHMARLAYEMRSILPCRQLREVRVDSIVFQGRQGAAVATHLKTLTHGDLQGLPKDHTFAKHMRTNSELASDECAFRVKTVQADDPLILRGFYRLPVIKAEAPEPCVDWSFITAEEVPQKHILEFSGGPGEPVREPMYSH